MLTFLFYCTLFIAQASTASASNKKPAPKQPSRPVVPQISAAKDSANFIEPINPTISLENGNFYRKFVDIAYLVPQEFNISRAYNSKSDRSGIFGPSWGFEYEKLLYSNIDGTIIIQEHGSGAKNIFAPAQRNTSILHQNIETIIQIAKKNGIFGSDAQLQEYRKKLETDVTFRSIESEKYKNELQSTIPPESTFYSTKFNYQFIKKQPEGFVRVFSETGMQEYFSEKGKLTHIQQRNNYTIHFYYATDGKLSMIQDSLNRKLKFKYNRLGLVESITTADNLQATYTYNTQGELISSIDINKQKHLYTYDANGRHLLTQIDYPDKKNITITYYPLSQNENVHQYKDRNGEMLEYIYKGNIFQNTTAEIQINHYNAFKKMINTSRHIYYSARNAFGESRVKKTVIISQGRTNESILDEKCQLPVQIIDTNGKNRFERSYTYDTKCRLIKKTTPFERVQVEYDAPTGKIISVKKTPLFSQNKPSVTTTYHFRYSAEGNMIEASSNHPQHPITVGIAYNRIGQIILIDQATHTLKFEYNEKGDPIVIDSIPKPTANGLLSKPHQIKIEYTNQGDIKNINSPSGSQVANLIMEEFESFSKLIEEASVSI